VKKLRYKEKLILLSKIRAGHNVDDWVDLLEADIKTERKDLLVLWAVIGISMGFFLGWFLAQ
jgi:hypothetical protein